MALTVQERAACHAALGDPIRLAIVDELSCSDRAPVELRRLLHVESNALAHHLDVLEHVGLIERWQSSGDRRRRYLRLRHDSLNRYLSPGRTRQPEPALFVCTHNSARSQLAAALWRTMTEAPAESAGTHPAASVHPGAVAAARRAGLDLSSALPRHVHDIATLPPLVVTVCDQAHEELPAERSWLHWSTADPVEQTTTEAFDATVRSLRARIATFIGTTAKAS